MEVKNIEIFKLFGSIFVDNDEANKSISKTDKKADGLGSRLGKGIKTAAKWAVGLTAAAAAVGAGMFAATKKVTEGFDKIAKTSTKLGVSTDAYQEMEYWAGQNGIATQQLERGLGRLNQRMGLAANGNEKYSNALTALGVDMDGVRNGTISTEDAFATSIKTLSEMTNEQEKSALASELFGTKLARDLMPALQDGSLSLEDAKKKAQELGIVIEGDTLSAAEKFNDTWDDLTRMMGAFGQKIIAKLIPAFQTMMEWVISHMPQIQNIFSTSFEIIGNVMSIFGTFLKEQVIDRLVALYEWIEPHFPMIKEFFMDAFGVAKEIIEGLVEAIQLATEWIKEHWAIVEPILIGIAAGVVAFQLITGAIAAYGAITKAITAVQLLFNGALRANPMGLVVTAIGLLVAAGVALYKNWDTVKEKLGSLWSSVKSFFTKIGDFIAKIWNGVIDGFKNLYTKAKNTFTNMKNAVLTTANSLVTGGIDKFNSFKSKAASIFNNVKSAITKPFSSAKNLVVNTASSLFTGARDKFNSLKSSASTIFNGVKTAITTPIDKARDLISTAIDKIKGFFSGLNLSFPKLKMPKLPHFSLKGSFSLAPPKVPKLGIDWYAKGGIMQKAMAFGANGNNLMVGGEAGSEAILPLTSKVLGGIGKGIAGTIPGDSNGESSRQMELLLQELIQAVKDGKNIIMNDREVGRIVEPHVTETQQRNKRKREAFD